MHKTNVQISPVHKHMQTNVQIAPVHRHTPSYTATSTFTAASLTGILLISLFSGAFWSGVVMLAGWSGGLFVMIVTTLMTFLGIVFCQGNSL